MIGAPIVTPIEDLPAALQGAARAMTYLTDADAFTDISRGKPLPHTLDDQTKARVGMTRDTWRLEIIASDDNQSHYPTAVDAPCEIDHPMTRKNGEALDFRQLMALADQHKVVYPKLMTCLNLAEPLGMGVWEGVPLSHVIALAKPRKNFRRIHFHGYHNDVPEQVFRSSISINRALESPPGIPPIILAYKLNGDWLSSERGAPVRIIIPETYGYKNIKWLQQITLTNNYQCNDTYAEWNNDPDTCLKSCAQFRLSGKSPTFAADAPLNLTGTAQVGLNGISAVEVAAVTPEQRESMDPEQPFDDAPWVRAFLLPPATTFCLS